MPFAPPDGNDPGFVPATKRRRTSSALFRPFKSPFKGVVRPSEPRTSPTIDGDPAERSSLPSEPSASTNVSQASAISTTVTIQSTANQRTPPPPPPPTLLSTYHKSSLQEIHHRQLASSSAELSSLQRHHSALLSQLGALRCTLDTYTQALKIESSSRDAELSRLIEIWMSASRAAAEELYGGVRDRVNRMGGVVAWRERESNRTKGWSGGWDEEAVGMRGAAGGGDCGENGENDEREGWDEGVSERREREEAEAEKKAERVREEEAKSGRDDEGFTMDMMLRSLKIDFEAIGWDRCEQRWID